MAVGSLAGIGLGTEMKGESEIAMEEAKLRAALQMCVDLLKYFREDVVRGNEKHLARVDLCLEESRLAGVRAG